MTNEEAQALLDLVVAYGQATAATTAAIHRGDRDVLEKERAASEVFRDLRALVLAEVDRG